MISRENAAVFAAEVAKFKAEHRDIAGQVGVWVDLALETTSMPKRPLRVWIDRTIEYRCLICANRVSAEAARSHGRCDGCMSVREQP